MSILYKVRVLCEGTQPAGIGEKVPKPEKIVRVYKEILLEVEDTIGWLERGDIAMRKGEEYADQHAEGHTRWMCFTALSAAPITLPIELKE